MVYVGHSNRHLHQPVAEHSCMMEFKIWKTHLREARIVKARSRKQLFKRRNILQFVSRAMLLIKVLIPSLNRPTRLYTSQTSIYMNTPKHVKYSLPLILSA